MRVLFLLFSLLLVSCSGLRTRYHEVAGGESLNQIADHYQVPVGQLEKYNSGALAMGLQPGMKLYIPFEESAYWSGQFSGVPASRHSREGEKSPDRDPGTAQAHFSWPLFGYVSSGFGARHGRVHEGIDIPAPKGTPVRAARSGHVIYAGNKIRGYGNLVIVRHADTFSTVYAHLSQISVKKGQFVSRGQKVGLVGRTGRATGSHLHFEIREDRVAVNPLLYLQGQYAHNILGR